MSLFKPNILIIDDQIQTAESIQELLTTLKHKSSIEIKSSSIIARLNLNSKINLILLDVNMPCIDGEKVLSKINYLFPHIVVITLATSNELQMAISSLRHGAFNYLLKPINKQQLSLSIMSFISSNNLPSVTKINYLNLITNNPQFTDIYHDIHILNFKREPITIFGEPGTGKKLIAKIIHCSSSSKYGSIFLFHLTNDDNISCKKKIQNILNGTIILLAFETLSVQNQASMVDEIKTLKARTSLNIIFCINSNEYSLHPENSSNSAIQHILKNKIAVPPVRERGNDIKLLAQFFLIKYTSQYGRYISNFQEEALMALKSYEFPDNVSEMDQIISSAVLLERSNELTLSSLPYHIKNKEKVEDQLQHFKFNAIVKVLNDAKGNRTQAAKKLGMARSTLNKLLREFKENTL